MILIITSSHYRIVYIEGLWYDQRTVCSDSRCYTPRGSLSGGGGLIVLVCCQPTELIWSFLFHKLSNFTPLSPPTSPPCPFPAANFLIFSCPSPETKYPRPGRLSSRSLVGLVIGWKYSDPRQVLTDLLCDFPRKVGQDSSRTHPGHCIPGCFLYVIGVISIMFQLWLICVAFSFHLHILNQSLQCFCITNAQ